MNEAVRILTAIEQGDRKAAEQLPPWFTTNSADWRPEGWRTSRRATHSRRRPGRHEALSAAGRHRPGSRGGTAKVTSSPPPPKP